MWIIDNFLPENIAKAMYREIIDSDKSTWKKFTRNDSLMYEQNDMSHVPKAFELISYLHSRNAVESLEKLTGIDGLIPDPKLIGSGYSWAGTGCTLKPHTDFNWNEQSKLHRALSLIIYLTPDWNPKWHGGLDFYDGKREKVIQHVDCLFNRCLIWKYEKLGWHGHVNPMTCPEDIGRTTVRVFYFTSNSSHNPEDLPHRSQYWMDKNGMPCDNRDQI
jgi:Rps23 Pro-64 3,4-dihydroxylase Tpa1-like proline 4-hydroxylase